MRINVVKRWPVFNFIKFDEMRCQAYAVVKISKEVCFVERLSKAASHITHLIMAPIVIKLRYTRSWRNQNGLHSRLKCISLWIIRLQTLPPRSLPSVCSHRSANLPVWTCTAFCTLWWWTARALWCPLWPPLRCGQVRFRDPRLSAELPRWWLSPLSSTNQIW